MASHEMNLYQISQDVNTDWDTYDSAVVAAESEADAKGIHPDGYSEVPYMSVLNGEDLRERRFGSWTGQDNVKVEYIGTAAPGIKRGVILSSYNAG